MNDATSKSFHKVAKRMGWMDEGGLEETEKKVFPKKTNTPTSQPQTRRPLSLFNSPVFVSDDEDDDNIVLKSTWRTRHTRPKSLPKTSENTPPLCNDDETSSSEEEFTSLLERLKKKNNFIGNSFLPNNSKARRQSERAETRSNQQVRLVNALIGHQIVSLFLLYTNICLHFALFFPSRIMLCKTPGCFLQSLTNPSSSYVGSFKHNKEALTSKLYHLYNTTVFESKLPANMSVTWNKKMRKTAGYCVTGQEKGGGNRYARIELSEKVCDSADRLRDTLIHEMCHAATWLINSVRDGHGNFWKLYARKATLAHPELPMVTRCHSYDIKYKFQYQCTRCKNTIGRHSKSLDTQRFVCALCTGQLVLLTPSKPRAPTPFANFVKENYSSVRQELAGQSHAEVMRKLSADFASKTKLSQS
uniref:Germ cell nuclear acidic peptidase n=1 Tax=Neolamprologus brichardi TaxID=32507 RepID=A0A3Q4H820_NEOBR